jgi:hypothetical protein
VLFPTVESPIPINHRRAAKQKSSTIKPVGRRRLLALQLCRLGFRTDHVREFNVQPM